MRVIAIVGGGSVARALGESASQAGYTVQFGVRDPASKTGLPGPALSLDESTTNASIVLLAVPASAALAALTAAGDLRGKIVIDCTNPLRWENGPVWAPPEAGSVAAELARAHPEIHVVKGFNHFGAEIQRDPSMPNGAADAFFASDHDEAKKVAMELAREMGFTPWDAGPLRNAAVLENLAMLWIHMSSVGGFGRQFTFRVEHR